MKQIATGLLLVALLIPAVSSAATYQYVDVNGITRTVVADNTVQARDRSVNVDANTIFTLVADATEPTVEDLQAIIANLEAQIAHLLSLLNGEEDDTNDGMGNPNTGNGNGNSNSSNDTEEVKKEKKELNENRGVGRAQAHLYVEESEDADGKTVILSVSDYYEGDDLTVEADVQPYDETERCGGKIAGSTLTLCSKDFYYRIDGQTKFTIDLNGEKRSVTIAPKGKSSLIKW